MSYAKTIFFIPIWFDDFKQFVKKTRDNNLWEHTSAEKVNPSYLFHYASNIAKSKDMFASFLLKDKTTLNLYMYNEECKNLNPQIEEVRLSCFATGVGFMEFWVAYEEISLKKIADFAYLFKKATKHYKKALLEEKRCLLDVAKSLLPKEYEDQLFFSASANFKCECNCLHFIHKDGIVPDSDELTSNLYRLCRSYNSLMQTTFDGEYDMIYKASEGDYWCGSTEGMVNITYDATDEEKDPSHYYLHVLKPKILSVDYYFLYLLLLNQKYTALQYIYIVSKVIDKPSKEIEKLNKRIIQLKNAFSFNVISDDKQFQNIYSKMFAILEIKHLLDDVIENEKQTEFLQNAKHANADRLSNKYLFGISILSLFSALIDSASYFDRIDGIKNISTTLSLASVSVILMLCIAWAIKSIKK